jgi:hypothetical protein
MSNNWTFVGTTVTLATAASQTIAGQVSITFTNVSGPADIGVTLCYQAVGAMGNPLLLNGIGTANMASIVNMYSSVTVASALAPGAGIWTVGVCSSNPNGAFIFNNSFTGYFLVLD